MAQISHADLMQGLDLGPSRVMPTDAPVALSADDHKNMVYLAQILTKAKNGALPRDRAPRHYVEPATLTPAHINMVLDKAAGYTNIEIGERWDYTPVQVANVLSHPDSQTILSTIQAMQAGSLVSMESRFAALAPEALNVKVGIMRDPDVSPGTRDRVATDILDRAGYSPRRHEEHTHKHQIVVPAEQAQALHSALAESQRIGIVDYSRHLHTSDADVVESHMLLESGPLEPEDGVPLVPASDVAPRGAQ